jgi:DNA-binding NarL/FixJ family response regulator
LNGLEVAARLSTLDRAIRLLVLSMHISEEYVLRALRSGCSGYMDKGSAVTELELAVRAVARGETFLSASLSWHAVDDYVRRTGGAADPLAALTSRQREILQLVAEGHRTRDIARRLGLSEKTVESHRGQIMERLRVHDLASLVRFAIRVGLVARES